MPFSLIYALSDLMFFLMYRIIKYRRNVVMINLHNSFPEKSDQELKRISTGFYHHLCDVLLESMKVYTMSVENVAKRYLFRDVQELEKIMADGTSVICVAGHYGNWEWVGIATVPQFSQRCIGFYKPLSNKYIDAFVARNRARGINRVASIEKTVQTFREFTKKEVGPSLFYMVADQSPPSHKMVHWVEFLNQETAVISGPDRYARMMGLPVVFLDVKKVKRGYYEADIIVISSDPAKSPTGEITLKYMQSLEKCITENPDLYLWSHRRWKHKKPAEQSLISAG